MEVVGPPDMDDHRFPVVARKAPDIRPIGLPDPELADDPVAYRKEILFRLKEPGIKNARPGILL